MFTITDMASKFKLCQKEMEVWFRQHSTVRTMMVLCGAAMRSNLQAFPSGFSALSMSQPWGNRRRPEDGHRAFLSQPHPALQAGQAGLPMSLCTPGSSLFGRTLLGNFASDGL